MNSDSTIQQQSDLTDKVWHFSDLNFQQVYRLRNHAAKSGNSNLLAAIKGFLNIRNGATGDPSTHIQLKAVDLDKVLINLPLEVKVVIDHEIVDTDVSENRSHELRELIMNKFDGKINVVFHSGLIDCDRLENDHVVLLALNTGFVVLKAPGTLTSGCIVVHPDLSLESLRQQIAEVDLSGGFTKPGEPLSPEIDLHALSLQEVYALYSQAQKEKNKPLRDKIYLFLNGRSGAFAETLESLLDKRQQMKADLLSGKISTAEYKKFLDKLYSANNCPIRNNFNRRNGSMAREHRFIEAGKLYQGDEQILVLVPHGTPDQSNTHSLQFWHLQEILNNADFQEDPDSSDIKDPTYKLIDSTFEERYKEGGLIQQEIAKADIVLSLNSFGQWVVLKTPNQELDDTYLWILKIPEVTLDELFVNNPKEVWVYIDHRQVDTNICENMYHAFANHMVELGRTDINLHLMSGHPSPEWLRDKDIVLMATPIGFFAETARQTPHTQKLIPKKELFGYDDFQGYPSLTSHCRAEFSREVKPLSSDNDPWNPLLIRYGLLSTQIPK